MKRLIIFFVIIPILGMDKENWQLQLGKGIISDDCELVESVCKTGADVNYTLDYACSFLHLASWHAGPKIVKILIEYRADLDKETEEGYSPLDTAIFRGKLTNIEALLHHGAKLKKKSLYYWAIANQVESLVIPKVLIAHGALIENEYSSPFYEHLKETISRRRFIDFEYVFDIVCFFLEHGADPNRNVDSVKELVESDFFKKEFMSCVLKSQVLYKTLNNTKKVKLIRNLVANYRPFFNLLRNNNLDDAVILAKGCSILRNLKDYKTGNTLLHYCAMKSEKDQFTYFLLRNPKACTYLNKQKQTPIHLLLHNEKGIEILKKLLVPKKYLFSEYWPLFNKMQFNPKAIFGYIECQQNYANQWANPEPVQERVD